jgi:hypothetical protein
MACNDVVKACCPAANIAEIIVALLQVVGTLKVPAAKRGHFFIIVGVDGEELGMDLLNSAVQRDRILAGLVYHVPGNLLYLIAVEGRLRRGC